MPHKPDFYPRSPCGERPSKNKKAAGNPYFYPRSPCGERPGQVDMDGVESPISIHALLAESDDRLRRAYHGRRISIHALLAESDVWAHQRYFAAYISIHALLAESDRIESSP